MLDKVALFMPSLKSNFILTDSIERRTSRLTLDLSGRSTHDAQDLIIGNDLDPLLSLSAPSESPF